MNKMNSLLLALSLATSASVAAEERQLTQFTSLKGEFTQGALLVGKTRPNTVITLNDKKVAVADNGTFVIGFGRDAKLENQLSFTFGEQTLNRDLLLNKRKYRESRVNGISKKITNPNPKNVARAQKDAKQVRAARAIWSDGQHFAQNFIWPAPGRISGVYGSVRYYNGKMGRPHYGVDMASPIGTPVVAPADGIVRLYVPDMFYSGGTLIIDHGMGVSSTFLHLSKGHVKAGDKVKQGDLIAEIGNTGRSTGPHLDWRMNWNNQRVDPQLLVPKR
ncbi:M23 family metallopeptidase [Psychrobium sp. MM17-31]|uniref:M23 family metallopeptidase n=1 Tax=Psychrobium sp. MM17-31 TaxID=2917758 RepID=UPI001EF480F2|nr:M23 family metallopeptidase [Psychrobium sp. MM17-31]MCG7531554.1 M23 family metallopeptidase [Psychrobium sp. MM17-31]